MIYIAFACVLFALVSYVRSAFGWMAIWIVGYFIAAALAV